MRPHDSFLPEYDINNSPISIWMIKNGFDSVGIIVACHARKAVCKMVPIELMAFFNEVDRHGDSFFSFGIAFDFSPPGSSSWSPFFQRKLDALEINLQKLASRYPKYIKMREIDCRRYLKAINTVKNHIIDIEASGFKRSPYSCTHSERKSLCLNQ